MTLTWLQAVLRGEHPPWPSPEDCDANHVLATAREEGVVALVHERMEDPDLAALVPGEVRTLFLGATRALLAQGMLREHECRRVLGEFQEAGIPTILLKGAALSYWAYSSPYLRDCADIDFLFRSKDDAGRAIGILRGLGYLPVKDGAVNPGSLVAFEQAFARDSPSSPTIVIDVHWRLSSSPVFAYRFDSDFLWSATQPLPILAPNAVGLSAAPSFVHACMHRVQDMAWGGQDCLKWIFDLYLLGNGFTAEDWAELADLAIARGLAGTCLDGLRVCGEMFGDPCPEPIRERLASAAATEPMKIPWMRHWAYIQFMTFLAFPTNGMRARWIWTRMFPSREYLQYRYGNSGGYLRLMASRLLAGARRLL